MLHVQPEKMALLVIDVQWDYWKLKLPQVPPATLLPKLKELISFCRSKNIKIIYVKHISPNQNSKYFREGTEGVEIMEEIKPQDGDEVIIKHMPGAFFNTSLQDILQEKGIENLIITGMMTDHCCDATAREAYALGYRNYFISDCTATFDLKDIHGQKISREEVQRVALAILSNGFAACLDTEAFMKLL